MSETSLVPRKCPVSQAFAAAWALMQNQTHKWSAKREKTDGADRCFVQRFSILTSTSSFFSSYFSYFVSTLQVLGGLWVKATMTTHCSNLHYWIGRDITDPNSYIWPNGEIIEWSSLKMIAGDNFMITKKLGQLLIDYNIENEDGLPFFRNRIWLGIGWE